MPLDPEIAKSIQENVAATVAEAIKPIGQRLADAVGQAMKPIGEQLAKLTAPAPAAEAVAAKEKDGKAAPLTMEGIMQGVTELLAKERQNNQVAATREGFIREKMKDLPPAYQSQLPTTGDATQLAAAEQKIREQYRADFKIANPAAANTEVGGKVPPGQKPGDTVDLSRLTAVQLIEEGLKEAKPARAPVDQTAAAVATA